MLMVVLMLMIVVVATAAMLTVFMMVFMVVIVVMTATAVLAMLMMVFMVVIVVVTASAVLAMLMMVMVLLFLQLCQISRNLCLTLHRFHQLRAGKLVPRCGDNGSLRIVFPQHSNSGIQLLLRDAVGTGQDNGRSSFDLVIVELTEVLHINLNLTGIYNRHCAVQNHILIGHLFHSRHHIGQLAHTGGFNHDPVGIVLCNHLIQSLTKIAHQAAADAAGVHFRNIDTRILQETAINTDLTKFIFDQHQFLSRITFGDHLFNQSCFAGTQKAGVYINFCHLLFHAFL